MSAAKKRQPSSSPAREATDRQESLRQVKIQAEYLKERLQKSILDNPILAKKSALLITLWIEGKGRMPQKKK